MKKLALSLALTLACGVAVACPDGMKSMDAQAPATSRFAAADAAPATPTRVETSKTKSGKTSAKPAVAAVAPGETKKAAGG